MKRRIFAASLALLASAFLCFGQGSKEKSQPPPTVDEENEKYLKPLIITPESGGAALPPILIGALQPVELPKEKDAWVVQVVTRGGFTGGGKGDVTITSAGKAACSPAALPCESHLPPAALQSLTQMIAAARPSKWENSALGTCRDCYVTMLTLHRREPEGCAKTYVVYWDDTTQGKMSAEVRQIYQEAVRLVAHEK